MTVNGYDTPEAAAMSTFPPQHVHVVASSSDGVNAYVLLDTGSPGQPYLYGVTCGRGTDGRWREGSSSNGCGWSATIEDGSRGMWTHWSEAGPGVDCVRMALEGDVIDAPVVEGAFLAVWFDRSYDEAIGPQIVAYRQHGEWKPYEGWQWH